MILRLLIYLFPKVRALQVRVTSANVDAAKSGNECSALRSELRDAQSRLSKESGQVEHWKARYEAVSDDLKFWKEQVRRAGERAEAADRETKDILKIAGDSLGIRVTGRRLFSKAPVEAPPDTQEARPPINVSQGAGRRFAGNVARQNNADFFKQRAVQAKIVPEADGERPN